MPARARLSQSRPWEPEATARTPDSNTVSLLAALGPIAPFPDGPRRAVMSERSSALTFTLALSRSPALVAVTLKTPSASAALAAARKQAPLSVASAPLGLARLK